MSLIGHWLNDEQIILKHCGQWRQSGNNWQMLPRDYRTVSMDIISKESSPCAPPRRCYCNGLHGAVHLSSSAMFTAAISSERDFVANDLPTDTTRHRAREETRSVTGPSASTFLPPDRVQFSNSNNLTKFVSLIAIHNQLSFERTSTSPESW